MNEKILVVDDEEDLCEILRFNLKNEGYDVTTAYSAEEALQLDLPKFQLILLDVMMGEISGFKMASMLKERKETTHIPVIFITAKDTVNDTCTGFSIGADDYISKPFSIREVILRVKAVLRRTAGVVPAVSHNLQYEDLTIDLESKKVRIGDREVALTKKEFQILQLLLENPGKVFSREEILKKVWTDEVYVLDRTVDVKITRLRKKITPYDSHIVTRQGYGYCFE